MKMAIEICKRIILSLFFVATFLNAKGQHFEGIVIDVLNANTIVVLNDDKEKKIVKLAYIEIPNTWKESGDFLKSIALAKEVVVKHLSNDRKGNIIGVVETNKGFNLNASMVHNGWALAYGKAYKKSEIHARNYKLGIWKPKESNFNLTKFILGTSSLFLF